MILTDPNVLEGGSRYDDTLKHYVIYSLVNLDNGKRYIGRTRNPKTRIKQHFVDLRAKKHSNPFINKDCDSHFGFEILEENITFDDRTDKERYYILLYKTYDEDYGYNVKDPCVRQIIERANRPMDIELFAFMYARADEETRQLVEKYLKWGKEQDARNQRSIRSRRRRYNSTSIRVC